ncbi:MAG TPA: FprA family A-type flavoprotein [Candidatus Sumerlaeota bacterium]|nr:FprA family A-type flavoprotein [Candidatus Sumerlaeota bacterium]
MQGIIPIRENIHWIGANDHETDLFESIWPLPRGVTYNSYIILDEKNALIDTVKGCYWAVYIEKIKSLLGPGKKLDFLIVNHMEPDHSGSMRDLLRLFPDIRIIGNAKTAEFIKDFYGITENVLEVRDGEEISLGAHKLQFFLTPMVHWPETMVTYEQKEKILFSCDAFGGFGALDDRIFDDEVDQDYYEYEILRYYSNIVGRYSGMVQKAIGRLKGIEIAVIAPSHGPIWRTEPGKIVALYDKWSRHETDEGVTLAYASMYGNTRRMMEAISRALADSGVEKVRIHDVSRTHLSHILVDIWRFRGIILGSPTYNTMIFPPMAALVSALKNRMMKKRVLGIFGGYTWSRGAVPAMQEFAKECAMPLVEPVIEIKCAPTLEDIENGALLGKNMAAEIRK